MTRHTALLTISIPQQLADAFDKLAPKRQKSAIICQLIREWMRTEVGLAEIDTQVELAQSKVDELKISAEQYHEAQADLERLMSVQLMDSDVVKASEELKEEKLQNLKLKNDIEEQLVKQRSDRAWLNLIGTEVWDDGTPGYLLYHNEAKGDHTIIRYHPPTSEKDWGTTDLHEIKKMTTRGDLPWIENCAEDCKKYKLKLWRGDGLPEYLMPFLQEKTGLVSCKPYAEDDIYFIKRIVEVDSLPDSHDLSILKTETTAETPLLEEK
jgi:metal-responsive CopG/Arc/MetJ family transcriptional regulator